MVLVVLLEGGCVCLLLGGCDGVVELIFGSIFGV